jgi:hypothetical protein
MKNNLLLILMVVSLIAPAYQLTAQSHKGKWMVEGNIGDLNFSNRKDMSVSGVGSRSQAKAYSVSVYPRIGYFITNSLVAGATLNFTYRLTKNDFYYSNGTQSTSGSSQLTTLGIAPFLRYYVLGKTSKNRLYVQVDGGVNSILSQKDKSTSYYENGTISGTSSGYQKGQTVFGEAFIGYNHFFTDNIAFNTAIGYSYNEQTTTFSNTGVFGNSTYVLPESQMKMKSTIFTWNFGFTLVFPGRKKDKTDK